MKLTGATCCYQLLSAYCFLYLLGSQQPDRTEAPSRRKPGAHENCKTEETVFHYRTGKGNNLHLVGCLWCQELGWEKPMSLWDMGSPSKYCGLP